MYLKYVSLVYTSPNLAPFRYTASYFWDTDHFETNALNDPKELEPYKVKCTPYIALAVYMHPKFQFVSLYDQAFSRYRQFWDKCKECPQNDLQAYKVKCTPYMCY